jgi:uncharacterized protein (TIGR00251 family)
MQRFNVQRALCDVGALRATRNASRACMARKCTNVSTSPRKPSWVLPPLPPTQLPLQIHDAPGGATLSVRVIPRAGQSRVAGVREGRLLVRLAAAPLEGAANDVLISFLADVYSVARRQVRVISGERTRDKRVQVAGVTAAQLSARIAAAGRGT